MYLLFDFKEIINKVSNFGEGIYDKTIGLLGALPGIARGIITVVILFFIVIGLITVLRKSFKFFGTILVIILIIAGVFFALSKFGII